MGFSIMYCPHCKKQTEHTTKAKTLPYTPHMGSERYHYETEFRCKECGRFNYIRAKLGRRSAMKKR